MKKLIRLPLLFLFYSTLISAQDLHFSQFYQHPLRLNPALAGIHKGDFRAGLQYRSQWQSVPVPFQTFAINGDKKLINRKNNILAAGLSLEHDRAGDAVLSWSQISLTCSAAHALSPTMAISAGLGLGFAQRRFDVSKLSFKNQWSGDIYDPGLPTKESFNQQSGLIPTLSGGLNLHLSQENRRTFLDVGLSASHLNKPNVSFKGAANSTLPMRFNAYANTKYQSSEYTDLIAFALAQQMGKNQELLIGAGLRLWLVREIGQEIAAQLSLGYRIGDAIIPALHFERNEWTFGLSYDLNISDFNIATNRKGGFELSAVYQDIPAPPIKARKVCPIF